MKRLATILALAAVALPAQKEKEDGFWWVRLSGRGERGFRVSEDGRRREPCAAMPGRDAVHSLDGKRWVRRGRAPDGRRTELFVGELGKADARLTRTPGDDSMAAWSPDGSAVVFCTRDAKHRWQVRLHHVWARIAPRQLSSFDGNAVRPALGPKGVVAWIEQPPTERFTKLPPGNLVLTDVSGGPRHVLEEKADLLGLSFSPNGRWLLAMRPGRIDVWNVKKRERDRSLDLTRIEGLGTSHGAWRPTWRPDSGAFACRITFLGGRMEGTEIYGDHELFVFPMARDGTPRAITLPRAVDGMGTLHWERR